MNFMRKILGNSYLELTCSKEALFEIIEKYIEGKETGVTNFAGTKN